MARLGEMLGFGDNPFYKAFNSNRNAVIGGFANMGSSPLNPAAGFSQGFAQGSMLDTLRADEAQEAAKLEEQTNVTRSWLEQQGFTDLVPLVDAGQADIAYGEALKRMGGGSGKDATFFGTPIWGVGPDGQPAFGQLNNQGEFQVTETPEGFQFGKEPIRMDAGTHFVLLDPVTRQQIGTIPKNGDVPTGFQQAPQGGIMPMPGSEADRERQAGNTQAAQALATLETKNGIALNAVDAALEQASGWNTGNVMGNSGWVPGLGQGALDLGKTLDTIKANIGFEELQTMRDNSPTGGALGQVTERELAFLQSTIANIEQSQSEEQLRRNLTILRDFLAQSQARRRAAYEQQYGGQQAPAPNSGIDDILSGYGL